MQIVLFLEKGKFIKNNYFYDNCELIKEKSQRKTPEMECKIFF